MQISPNTTSGTPVTVRTPMAAKRSRSNDPFRRDPLACQLMDAVGPLIEDDGSGDFELAPGIFEVDVYRALLPICRDYTTADAMRAFMSVHPATEKMHLRGTARDRTARYFAGHTLAAFIAIAAPSKPEDVAALAQILTLRDSHEKTEPVMVEVARCLAALNLADGIKALIRGDFSCGETFGSAGLGTRPHCWCYRIAKASDRMKWWYDPKRPAPAKVEG